MCERYIDRLITSHTPPIEDLSHNTGTCPYWESNRPPISSQAGTQCTEPPQPGLEALFSSLIPVARTSSTMLNKSDRSGQTCLVTDPK